MKNRIKILLPVIIPFFISSSVHAQKKYEIKSEKELNNFLFTEVRKYNDTLCNNVKQTGILFIKFQVNKKGTLDSIRYSIKQPKALIYVLTQVLNKVKLTENEKDNLTYVLPLFFDYQPEFKPTQTLDDLRSQVIIYDSTDLSSYLNFDFNGFFNVPDSEKNLWGIKCVLLPMIKISRPIVYH